MAATKKLDKVIEKAFYKAFAGHPIELHKIPEIYKALKAAILAGESPSEAAAALVPIYEVKGG